MVTAPETIAKSIHATLDKEVQTVDGNISPDLRRSVYASRDEAASAFTPAATLTQKAMAFISEIKDTRSVECCIDLLHALVTQILVDEKDLNITLADLMATPPLDTDKGAYELRKHILRIPESPPTWPSTRR